MKENLPKQINHIKKPQVSHEVNNTWSLNTGRKPSGTSQQKHSNIDISG